MPIVRCFDRVCLKDIPPGPSVVSRFGMLIICIVWCPQQQSIKVVYVQFSNIDEVYRTVTEVWLYCLQLVIKGNRVVASRVLLNKSFSFDSFLYSCSHFSSILSCLYSVIGLNYHFDNMVDADIISGHSQKRLTVRMVNCSKVHFGIVWIVLGWLWDTSLGQDGVSKPRWVPANSLAHVESNVEVEKQ